MLACRVQACPVQVCPVQASLVLVLLVRDWIPEVYCLCTQSQPVIASLQRSGSSMSIVQQRQQAQAEQRQAAEELRNAFASMASEAQTSKRFAATQILHLSKLGTVALLQFISITCDS